MMIKNPCVTDTEINKKKFMFYRSLSENPNNPMLFLVVLTFFFFRYAQAGGTGNNPQGGDKDEKLNWISYVFLSHFFIVLSVSGWFQTNVARPVFVSVALT